MSVETSEPVTKEDLKSIRYDSTGLASMVIATIFLATFSIMAVDGQTDLAVFFAASSAVFIVLGYFAEYKKRKLESGTPIRDAAKKIRGVFS